jgi:hypothetical protein|tara:strand:+ start:9299 stop:9550 length:252 start_codon:yes stop_codon:yes gene_type:complete
MSKKITRKEKEGQTLSVDLKIRVLNAKKELPHSGVTSLFFHYFKEDYKDTIKNKSRLNNVLQTRITDLDMTLRIEQLVKLLNN